MNYDFNKIEAGFQNAELYFADQATQDYFKFFTEVEGADMLQYAYMSAEDYDKLIKYNENYYLFHDEVAIIKNNKAILSTYLDSVTDIVEIGPGSPYVITRKTLPFLEYAKNLKHYCAIDISAEYISHVCQFIKQEMPHLEVSSLEADLLQPTPFELKNSYGKKCVLCLGSTLGNFNSNQQLHILTQFSNLTEIGDILIFAADTNMDRNLLLNAYDADFTKPFLKGILKYFGNINQDFVPYIEEFDVKTAWNEKLNLIQQSFVTRKDISFKFNNRTIKLYKGQELRGVKSRKFNVETINNILNKCSYNLLDVLDYSNKMRLFICKRVK